MKSNKFLFECLADPIERDLFHQCYHGPNDVEARVAYADFLEARDPVRAEALRLEAVLAARTEVPSLADDRLRLRVLIAQVDPVWWELVSLGPSTRNCGKLKEGELRVRFRFECPVAWTTLQNTDDPNVRFCDECKEHVYFCESDRDVSWHALHGHCIAIERALESRKHRDLTASFTGRPDFVAIWADRIFSASQDGE